MMMADIIVQEKTIRIKVLVPSETHKGAYYLVERDLHGWVCSCPDHTTRGRDCKHIKRAQEEIEVE